MLEFAAMLDPKSKPTELRRKGVVAGEKAAATGQSWRDLPVGKRLEHALIKARTRCRTPRLFCPHTRAQG